MRCNVLDAIAIEVDLSSVADALDIFLTRHGRVDVLIGSSGGNAGCASTIAVSFTASSVIDVSRPLRLHLLFAEVCFPWL